MMMKRKKQKTAQPPPTTSASSAPSDIKSLIRKNFSFFDNLIELIPAKFYLPTDDDSKPYFQGLKKSAKQAAKQQTKDNIKKSRRDRLDPDKSHTSTLDLLKQTLEKEKQAAKTIPGPTEDDVGPVRSVTFEELRQRLHRRIEELRGNRGGGEAWRSEKREKRENEYRKRKRGDDDDDDQVEGEKNGDGRGGNIGKSEGEIEKKVTKASERIEFGKLKIGSGEERRKKKKLSKEKELEMAKRLEEEVKKDPAMAKKHSWKAAVSRASGDKVHDDPKLLKQSMNKEKRRHEKNVGKWKERVESREKVKGEKQQKRAGNIAERIHQKKMRKIAKREKKLMRPGFEGRKEGYINQN